MVTRHHVVIKRGVHRSGPSLLESSCEGSSVIIKAAWKIELPILKSA